MHNVVVLEIGNILGFFRHNEGNTIENFLFSKYYTNS